MHGSLSFYHSSSSDLPEVNARGPCDYTAANSHPVAGSGREAPVVRWPPATADAPLLPLREPPPPRSSCHQRRASRPRLIRARPLGESIELHSSEGGSSGNPSDEDAHPHRRGNCLGRKRHACGHRAARGWYRFVALARGAIERPPSELDDENNDHDNNDHNNDDDFYGEGGGGGAAARQLAPPVSFLEGLWQLALVVVWDIIHPDSRFRSFWDGLIVIGLMYVALITTFLLCFNFEADNHVSVFEILDALIYIVFLLDICFNFRTALRRGHDAASRNVVIIRRRVIAVHYLTGWFAVDILAALPWSAITSSLSSYMQLLKLLRLIRLLRLLQMPKAMQRSRLYLNVEQAQGAAMMRLLSYLVGAVLVLHMSASAWFFVAVIEDRGLVGTWAEVAGLQDASNFERYLTSLYFVVITYTTVGYGDVFPVTTPERVLTCAGMLVGVVTLGTIISTANSIAGRANKYEIAKEELLDGVEGFLAAQALPPRLATRVKNYYAYVANKQFNDKEDTQLVADLPCDLRRDVLRGIHTRLITRVPFLRDAAVRHEALVLELSSTLKLEFASKGECVVMEGGWDTELYFVTEGRLQVRQYLPSGGRGTAAAGATTPPPPPPPPPLSLHQASTQPEVSAAAAALEGDTEVSAAAAAAAAGQLQAQETSARQSVAEAAAAAAATTTSTVTIAASSRAAMAPAAAASGGGGGVPSQPAASSLAMVRRWLTGMQARSSQAEHVLEMYGGSSMLQPLPAAAAPQAGQNGGVAPAAGAAALSAVAASITTTTAVTAAEVEVEVEASSLGSGAAIGSSTSPLAGAACASTNGRTTPPAFAAVGQEVLPGSTVLQRPSSPSLHMQSQEDRRRKWRMTYDRSVPYKALRMLKPGAYFGEYGCLTGCPRTASVVAVRMTELYGLRREDLAAALARWPELEAAWQRCEEYGARERERLRLRLQGGRAPRAMSLSTSDPADAATDDDDRAEAAISGSKRYKDFMTCFGGGGAAAADTADEPAEAMTGTVSEAMSMAGAPTEARGGEQSAGRKEAAEGCA